MNDLIAQGGAGGVGALVGAFASFLGFKSRLDAQDKRLDTLAGSVMYEDTCEATIKGMEKQLESLEKQVTETGKDVKALLRKNL